MILDASQPFPTLPFPLRSLIGMREEIAPVGEGELAYTIQGRTRLLPPAWGSKLGFVLSNSGDRVVVPPLEQLRPGTLLRYHSVLWRTRVFAPGQASGSIERAPVPGSVKAFDEDGNAVEATTGFAGGVHLVNVFPGNFVTNVHYRLAHDVIVTGHSGLSSDLTGRARAFSLAFEEEYAQ